MKIAVGCDEAAYDMKEAIKAELTRQGHEVVDFGTHDGAPVLYPDIGVALAEGVAAGQAERASKSNDAQIITVGARVVGLELAKAIVQSFISSQFEPRSLPKIEALSAHERRLRQG